MQVTSQLHHILGATMQKGQAPNESLCRRTERTNEGRMKTQQELQNGEMPQ